MTAGTAFWMEHVAAIERDGIAASKYARSHGLSVTALYYWRRKLQASAPAPAPMDKFLTMSIVPAAQTAQAPAFTLWLGSVRLEMPALPPPEWLAAVALACKDGC